MLTRFSLSQTEAEALAAACMDEARRRGVAVSIAVVDDAGQLLRLVRMDGARAFTTDLAQQKARAAASVGAPTRMIESVGKAPVGGPGGAPAMHEGQCAGAIGVSGAQPDVDEAIVSHALSAGWSHPADPGA